jgi:hypothetical protein
MKQLRKDHIALPEDFTILENIYDKCTHQSRTTKCGLDVVVANKDDNNTKALHDWRRSENSTRGNGKEPSDDIDDCKTMVDDDDDDDMADYDHNVDNDDDKNNNMVDDKTDRHGKKNDRPFHSWECLLSVGMVDGKQCFTTDVHQKMNAASLFLPASQLHVSE